MTALITGAAGFLGKRVTEQLLAKGQPVRALVRKPDQAQALRACGAEAVVGDVLDAASVRSAVRGATAVYHCAAAVGASYSPEQIYEVNLGGTRNVIDALCEAGSGRLVLVSTINVLGMRSLDHATEDTPVRRSKEASSDVKIDAERLVLDRRRERGLDVVIVRPPLLYGPGEHNTPRLIKAIRKGKFRYLGSRDNLIPMAHVDDAAQIMVLAGTVPAASGRIYHFTDGAETSIGQMIDYLSELIGSPAPQKVLPYVVPAAVCRVFETLRLLHLVHGAGPVNRVTLRFLGTSRSLDVSRAQKELGYQPKIGFRDGMASTVRWIADHNQD